MKLNAALFGTLLLVVLPVSPTLAKPSHAYSVWGDQPKYGPDIKHLDYVNPDAPKGGVLRLSETGTFDSVNPFILKGTKPGSFDPSVRSMYAIAGFDGVFESLLGGTADESLVAYCNVCETVDVADDVSWVEFVIRPEAKFHDGEPIKPSDVVFSYHVLMEKGHPRFKVQFEPIENVQVVNDRTVKFTFKTKNDRLLPPLAGGIPIIPEHYWKTRDFTKTTVEPPLGSGPYRLAEVEAGKYLVYERVKNYWGEKLPMNRGLNNFDQVRYDFYRDHNVSFEAFKAGDHDFVKEYTSKRWATQYDFPLLKQGKYKKEMLKHQEPASVQGFVFNTRRFIFKDRKVREALSYAYDFEWANKNLFYGQYVRTDSYFPNSVLKASGMPTQDELKLLEPFRKDLPDEVFRQAYVPPKTDGSGNNRNNLRRAAKLLKESGWVIQDKKLVHAETGEPFKFEILLHQSGIERIVLPFKQNLERLGIEVSVRMVDVAEYTRRQRDFDFDMVVFGSTRGFRPHVGLRLMFSSATANEKGSMNLFGIHDPVVDALVETIIDAQSRTGLKTATNALDRVLTWGHYQIFNWYIDSYRIAYNAKLKRPKIRPPYDLGLSTWWWGS